MEPDDPLTNSFPVAPADRAGRGRDEGLPPRVGP